MANKTLKQVQDEQKSYFGAEVGKNENNKLLWNALYKHIGHDVCIAAYGDVSNPFSIALECNDCNEVIVDAETYTVKERTDI